MKISVVIPMYNERAIAEGSAATFSAYMKEHFDEYELIFSDDGSADGCGEIVRCYGAAHDPNLCVVRSEKNRGKGAAVRAGVLASTGDVVMFTDCDIAYGTDVIGAVYDFFRENDREVEKGGDRISVAVGSRNLSRDGYAGYTFLRRLASKAYIRMLAIIAGFSLSDSQCGMKGFRGDDGRRIFAECEIDGFAFDFEVLLTAAAKKMKIREIPVRIINHRASTVHVFRDSVRMMRDVLRIKKTVKAKNK